MRCVICKNDEMQDSRSTYFAQVDQCYVIIENVPCKKCSHCGKIVYSVSVMEKIEENLDKVREITGKILIMDYSQAA